MEEIFWATDRSGLAVAIERVATNPETDPIWNQPSIIHFRYLNYKRPRRGHLPEGEFLNQWEAQPHIDLKRLPPKSVWRPIRSYSWLIVSKLRREHEDPLRENAQKRYILIGHRGTTPVLEGYSGYSQMLVGGKTHRFRTLHHFFQNNILQLDQTPQDVIEKSKRKPKPKKERRTLWERLDDEIL